MREREFDPSEKYKNIFRTSINKNELPFYQQAAEFFQGVEVKAIAQEGETWQSIHRSFRYSLSDPLTVFEGSVAIEINRSSNPNLASTMTPYYEKVEEIAKSQTQPPETR